MFGSDSSQSSIAQSEIQYEPLCRLFSLGEIQSLTNNFDDKSIVGIGGFGTVYKGFIDGGSTSVAVKRLNPESKQGEEEFWTEVRMLSKLRYAHLVTLIGYCNEGDEMIIVYEYIPNGTLAHHLYKIGSTRDGNCGFSLNWEQRLNICIGAARGLNYLHTGTEQSFIHRDVKSTNILLDENWVAKISDFGLSKGSETQSQTHVSTAVKGTFGYLDPDYFLTRRLTKKSDVYAFGVVMLEVLCGRPAVDTRLDEERISLVFWTKQCIQKSMVYQIIDPSLRGQILPHSLKYFVEVASNCLHDRPPGRPTMAEVVTSLIHALASNKKNSGIVTENVEDHRLAPTKKRHSRFCITSWIKSIQNALPNNVEFHIGLPEANTGSYNNTVSSSYSEFPVTGNHASEYRNSQFQNTHKNI